MLCNSAAAFLFVLIRFQHSYGYEAQAQIATSARMDISRVQMFTQCEMTAEMSIQRDERRSERGGGGVIFPCEERGVGFLL